MAYTTIDDPEKYFQTLIWTGNGSDNRALTNTGRYDLQPDILMIKNRDDSDPWYFGDTSALGNDGDLPHGGNISPHSYFQIDSASARQDDDNVVVSLQSDGFTVGTSTLSNSNNEKHVAWQWNITDGATITNDNVANNEGNLSTYQKKNTTSKMVQGYYVGSGNANIQYGHGLGVAPTFIFIRCLSRTENGRVYMKGAETANGGMQNLDDAANVNNTNTLLYAKPDATDFAVGTDLSVGGDGHTYFFWAFADVQGFSKSNKYIGNGNVDGPFAYCGFKPAFVMMKNSDASNGDSWHIYDNKRDPINPAYRKLFPDQAANENAATAIAIDLLSNGFKVRGTDGGINESGSTYAFIAFAESTFVTSTGIPCTAR
tara:strand:- start:322 stop:1437 length:1116 start_codon:yes stop_codon:yes gene_type:complete